MIDVQALKNKILNFAMRGQLTKQKLEDGSAEELYAKINTEKARLIKEGIIRKEKFLGTISDETPFDIPVNWRWVHLGEIFKHNTGKALNASDNEGNLLEYITTSNLYWDHFELNNLKKMYFRDDEIDKCTIKKGDLLICEGGDIGRSAIWNFPYEMRIQNHIHKLRPYLPTLSTAFYYYVMRLYKAINKIDGLGIGLQGFSSGRLHSLVVPLPPLPEQERIVKKIDAIFVLLDKIDALQNQFVSNQEALKSKLIDVAIQGKLTKQLPEDGTAKDLIQLINKEREIQEANGKIKHVESQSSIDDDEIPFEIPSNWEWVRFGDVSYIVRGGSPRPIKQYITSNKNGINWIKIGDVEKGGKYIFETKEKIIPEGEKKSRRVYPGDFLLTNSMSFGRPYISKIEGCIHDGWLLIHDLKGFDQDYLYYLLSSEFLYNQFTQKASGSTVDNLNIDKVSSAIIPLPPLREQKRIAKKIEEMLQYCK